MGCISPNIKENVKVTVLGTAIEERIVHLFARNMWKAKRLSTTILQAATEFPSSEISVTTTTRMLLFIFYSAR
ncbi:hypothetical protein Glove_219g46 [Diversispora epigaea]|uniref:Uncharacterized protein n=1 Tax=Diversispora epigaea TaxID=1348612 RepID=A0A397IIX0_9GLOM|nr:hypothetical protein Glove_219g46 [Diversispora epigaea]